MENEQLDLLTVVEDELILSLPQVVYHDETECHVSAEQLVSKTEGAADESASAKNPFRGAQCFEKQWRFERQKVSITYPTYLGVNTHGSSTEP